MSAPRVVQLAMVVTISFSCNASAQTVSTLVNDAPDGFVRLTYTARPGVCGDGQRFVHSDNDGHWGPGANCSNGPVHLLLTKVDGEITRVRAHVGGRWRTMGSGTTDVGRVPSAEAARYLLQLARTDRVGHRAIMPATLADSVEVWPALRDLAVDDALSSRVRRESLQWLGMLAGRVLSDDETADPDREWRRQAVFALSQLPKDEGIPRLIDLARDHRYDYVRRLALFWLGQSGDPRAIPVIEAVFSN